MRFLLDEMCSPDVSVRLRSLGNEALAVKERTELSGLSDAMLLAIAANEGLVLVTENMKDFVAPHRQWTMTNREHAGVVLVHPHRFRRSRHSAQRLADALARFAEDYSGELAGIESFVWWLDPPGR